MKKRELNRYIRDVKHSLPCSRKEAAQLTRQLKTDIAAYLEENPDADMNAITSRFGSPQQIASAYIDEMSSKELQRRLRIRKKVLSIVLACVVMILIIWIGVAIYASIDAAKSNDGYIETSPIITDYVSDKSDPVLAERRDIAESYMRSMATMLWTPDEDVLYTLSGGIDPQESDPSKQLRLYAGRVYRGVPYSYAGSTDTAFLEYATGQDEQGIYQVSGLHWKALSGGGANYARLGNDCSSAVMQAWSQIGASVPMTSTQYMTPNNGYLRVGDYVSDPDDNTNSDATCQENGTDVMYDAYAQLQKADALVARWSGSGHARMVVDVTVVRSENGTIDGQKSCVTILEQTSGNQRTQQRLYDMQLGMDVYYIYSVDTNYSFYELYNDGYLPITCKELIDPSPIPEAQVEDSETQHTKDTILTGLITANRYIDTVTVTITGADGAAVQEGALRGTRGSNHQVDLQRFITEDPERLRGAVDPDALPSGSYHCQLVCRLTNGQEFTVRDFDFTV